jgi:(p)ppGpp synthase/HD superfamily hydrolase
MLKGISLVRLAQVIAQEAHADQERVGGESYIHHPHRVAMMVRYRGPQYYIVGLLHDVVEDSDIEIADIRYIFGDEVADAVDSVTRREDETYMDMIRRACENPIGRAVKLADNLDNTRSLHTLPEDRRKLQEKRYARARALLEKEHARLTP